MCGIAGLFYPGGTIEESDLKLMNSCISHRGPDESGYYCNGGIGFAHQRLSILDVEGGSQPIYNEDGTVVTVFNGEIYNYQELVRELSAAGHEFSTETDTEVIVHLYEEYGHSFVRHLRGMFSIALWDETDGQLVLARDRMGIKPLLYGFNNGRYAFSSELPAILESSFNHGPVDEVALKQYFSLGFIPAPKTAFKHVRKVEPGEMVIITDGGVQNSRYYTPKVSRCNDSFADAQKNLRTKITKAVKTRLQSDVPLGAFLSGGIDSSIVVGILSDILDERVKTFTVGFRDSPLDESWAARQVADYHNTDHTEFTVSPDDIKSVLPRVLDKFGEPFGDQSILPTYIVARETSGKVKVALSGDGADELFAGYDRYRAEYLSKFYRQIPQSMRNGIRSVVSATQSSRENHILEKLHKVQQFVETADYTDDPERHFEWRRVPPVNVNPFPGLEVNQAGKRIYEQYHENNNLPEEYGSIKAMQLVDFQVPLPNKILQKTDLASMYNSLEVRVPMLDKDVVEYALSLPSEYSITPTKRKYILKSTFDDLLPQSILNRSKRGFDMPIGEWLKNDLNEDFRRSVRESTDKIVDDSVVMSAFEDHISGKRSHWRFLWNIYVFKKWHHRMEKQGYI